MSNEQQKEVGRFMATGLVATILDYVLLNMLTVVMGIPVLIANSISAPFSSFVSYKFNKNVVFEDRIYGKRKTILRYILILGFGILIIQNSLIHVLSDSFAMTIAQSIHPLLDAVGLGKIPDSALAINIAKVCGSLVGAAWNYVMLRKFVFVTQEDAKN